MPCGSPLGRRIFPLGDGTRRDLTSGGGLLHAHLGELAQQVANRATLHFAIEVEGSLPLLCDPPSERRHYESRYSVRDYGILVTLRLPPRTLGDSFRGDRRNHRCRPGLNPLEATSSRAGDGTAGIHAMVCRAQSRPRSAVALSLRTSGGTGHWEIAAPVKETHDASGKYSTGVGRIVGVHRQAFSRRSDGPDCQAPAPRGRTVGRVQGPEPHRRAEGKGQRVGEGVRAEV